LTLSGIAAELFLEKFHQGKKSRNVSKGASGLLLSLHQLRRGVAMKSVIPGYGSRLAHKSLNAV
jgi:hypothetical protein